MKKTLNNFFRKKPKKSVKENLAVEETASPLERLQRLHNSSTDEAAPPRSSTTSTLSNEEIEQDFDDESVLSETAIPYVIKTDINTDEVYLLRLTEEQLHLVTSFLDIPDLVSLTLLSKEVKRKLKLTPIYLSRLVKPIFQNLLEEICKPVIFDDGSRSAQWTIGSVITGAQDLNPILQTFPFKGQKVISFGVANKFFKNLKPISALTNIKRLELQSCYQLTDITPIQTLPQLDTVLFMLCKDLTNLEPVRQLRNLRTIQLHSCDNLEDMSPLADMAIERLILSKCNSITDFSVLKSLKNLTLLDASQTKISKVEFHSNTKMEQLHLEDCEKLESVVSFDGSKLKVMRLTPNKSLTLPPSILSDAPNLLSLHLPGNLSLTSLDSIKSCIKLADLNLHNCRKLVNISSLPTSLVKLNISGCKSLNPKSAKYILRCRKLLDLSVTDTPSKVLAVVLLKAKYVIRTHTAQLLAKSNIGGKEALDICEALMNEKGDKFMVLHQVAYLTRSSSTFKSLFYASRMPGVFIKSLKDLEEKYVVEVLELLLTNFDGTNNVFTKHEDWVQTVLLVHELLRKDSVQVNSSVLKLLSSILEHVPLTPGFISRCDTFAKTVTLYESLADNITNQVCLNETFTVIKALIGAFALENSRAGMVEVPEQPALSLSEALIEQIVMYFVNESKDADLALAGLLVELPPDKRVVESDKLPKLMEDVLTSAMPKAVLGIVTSQNEMFQEIRRRIGVVRELSTILPRKRFPSLTPQVTLVFYHLQNTAEFHAAPAQYQHPRVEALGELVEDLIAILDIILVPDEKDNFCVRIDRISSTFSRVMGNLVNHRELFRVAVELHMKLMRLSPSYKESAVSMFVNSDMRRSLRMFGKNKLEVIQLFSLLVESPSVVEKFMQFNGKEFDGFLGQLHDFAIKSENLEDGVHKQLAQFVSRLSGSSRVVHHLILPCISLIRKLHKDEWLSELKDEMELASRPPQPAFDALAAILPFFFRGHTPQLAVRDDTPEHRAEIIAKSDFALLCRVKNVSILLKLVILSENGNSSATLLSLIDEAFLKSLYGFAKDRSETDASKHVLSLMCTVLFLVSKSDTSLIPTFTTASDDTTPQDVQESTEAEMLSVRRYLSQKRKNKLLRSLKKSLLAESQKRPGVKEQEDIAEKTKKESMMQGLRHQIWAFFPGDQVSDKLMTLVNTNWKKYMDAISLETVLQAAYACVVQFDAAFWGKHGKDVLSLAQEKLELNPTCLSDLLQQVYYLDEEGAISVLNHVSKQSSETIKAYLKNMTTNDIIHTITRKSKLLPRLLNAIVAGELPAEDFYSMALDVLGNDGEICVNSITASNMPFWRLLVSWMEEESDAGKRVMQWVKDIQNPRFVSKVLVDGGLMKVLDKWGGKNPLTTYQYEMGCLALAIASEGKREEARITQPVLDAVYKVLMETPSAALSKTLSFFTEKHYDEAPAEIKHCSENLKLWRGFLGDAAGNFIEYENVLGTVATVKTVELPSLVKPIYCEVDLISIEKNADLFLGIVSDEYKSGTFVGDLQDTSALLKLPTSERTCFGVLIDAGNNMLKVYSNGKLNQEMPLEPANIGRFVLAGKSAVAQINLGEEPCQFQPDVDEFNMYLHST